ncbi:hypothetical protein G5B40_17120 [Pikeienuella piscinae]|uniref:Uncharacterized protein n=1 Tax=Pikeienuella piscinae TaxID=2748098 RepID=A0A7L5C1K0_9RHOB|nr:hypothetical protein [Pikeienuella piscinae]QIE57008.1 hypothetical protein G5B40_17120 [Pikeienuella piscinae]
MKQTEPRREPIVDANSPAIISAYEKRVAQLEQEKQVLLERNEKSAARQSSFEEMHELSMKFLSNPWNMRVSG